MKLSDWARQNGVHPKTALRWFDRGILPVPARKVGPRTILVDLNAALNLKRWGEQVLAGQTSLGPRTSTVAGSAPETLNACGGERQSTLCVAAADEAGTEQPRPAASDSEPTANIGGLQREDVPYVPC